MISLLSQGAKKVSFTARHPCVIAHKSFRLAPKPFLITRIDYNPSSSKNSTCPSGKLRIRKPWAIGRDFLYTLTLYNYPTPFSIENGHVSQWHINFETFNYSPEQ